MRSLLKYIVPALFLCAAYSFRQVSDAAHQRTGIAFFHFSHVRDTTRAFRVWEEDFQLAYGQQQSVYLSATRMQQDSLHRAAFEEAMRTNSTTVNMGVLKPVTPETVYVTGDAVYVNRSFNRANYLVKEPLEKPDWRISTETKQLLGYTCQKATGIVKGRSYTAWFTTDIPAGFGPWKLHGLPGLILEAYDDSNRIRFHCTRIAPDAALPAGVSLEPPTDATATTHTDFHKMETAYREGLLANAMGNNDITIDQVTVNGAATTASRKVPVINYPLELTK